MAPNGIRSAALFCLVASLFLSAGSVRGQSPADKLGASLDQLDQWLAGSSEADGWHQHLQTHRLRDQLAKGGKADPIAVLEILGRYVSEVPGLDTPEFYRVRRALENWLAELPPPSVDQLPNTLRRARSVFIPRTKNDLVDAKADLVAAVGRLDARLKLDGPNGLVWRKFLLWDRMQGELAKDAPDLRALDAVYARYASGREGLLLLWFADVRQSLRYYLSTARAVGDRKVQAQYQTLLDDLAGQLEQYRKNPSADQAATIHEMLEWLQDAGQPRYLIKAVQCSYSLPNLFVQASAGLVGAGIAAPIDETAPITDCILKTAIQGTSHTVGRVYTELVPAGDRAEIEAVFEGTVHTDAVGYNGPVQIFSNSITNVVGRKRLLMDLERAWSLPACSDAVTCTDIHDIQSNRGSAMIENLAWKRSAKQKPQSEQVAAQHAGQRANERIDRQGDEAIVRLNARYKERFHQPLSQRNLFPRAASLSTTKDALHVTALGGRLTELGAPSEPPAAKEASDLGAQIHESMFNNLCADAFAGALVEEERFLATLKDVLGELPDKFKQEDKAEPWAITFARSQPISATFREGTVTLTLRGQKYVKGDGQYPGMNVTAAYKIQQMPQGIKWVRQGGLQIFPPGFEPGSGQTLSARQQVLRDLLQRRFNKIFEPEIVPKPLVFSGNWQKAGQLGLVECRALDGWLVLGWRRIPGTESAPTPLKPVAATAMR